MRKLLTDKILLASCRLTNYSNKSRIKIDTNIKDKEC